MLYVTKMLGREYYREPSNERVSYEIVTDRARLSLVRLWKRNRPPDEKRIQEIQDHIIDTNVVDGQILLAIVNGECVCYDGSHRLEACKKSFPTGGVQVRILYDSTDLEVGREFTRINKSVPVPELYFSTDEISMRLTTVIQEISRGLTHTYPSYVSASRKPRRPNFNRDVFAEELGSILRECLDNETLMGLTGDMIDKWLMDTNSRIRKNHYCNDPRIKASQSVLKKCELHKFYLFAGDWIPIFKTQLTQQSNPIS